MNKHKLPSLSLVLSVLILSACASGGTPPTVANSMNPRLETDAIDKVMERALADAEANGNAQEILAMLAQVHKRNPDDPIVAVRYARALRDDEQINAAIRTLEPFTKGPTPNIEAVTEMSMTQITLGDFEEAEIYANKSLKIDPKNARAFLALGTAQDALNRHQEAEVSFRQGLKYWQGDATPILNNLALNLASQGHLEESLALIEKAQKLAPNRIELERNRRIIATLLETTGPRPPSPNAKPTTVENKPAPASTPVPEKKNITAEETKPVVQETVKEVEKKIEDASTENKMDVKVDPQIKVKSNIKLKPLND